jgi:hypothetical protein
MNCNWILKSRARGSSTFLKKEIVKFLQILPNWEELTIELDAIILAEGGGSDGWYSNGVLAICAWEKDKSVTLNKDYFNDHKDIFERLKLEYEIKSSGVICQFNEKQIIAYQLLHIFLHELGHHHDRVSTKEKIDNAPRGERYAEDYALKYERIIWNRFFEEFKMI